VHPVAVTIARTNYLLALGELVRGPHPPVLLPVYLSNALVPPGSTAQAEPLGGYPEVVHTVYTGQPGLVFELPHSVASSPEMLDWLFFRLNQYLDGAQQRHRFQPREEAIQAVLAAFHNYLVSPKVRTPIPEPLTAFAAEVMERTARRVIELCLDCQDHLWLFILKNLPASVYLAQRKFDLVVGNQMGLAGDFLACCAGLYVKDAGWVAAVMAKETGAQLARPMGSFTLERVLDLEGVSPPFNVPARVLMARKVNPLTASQPPFIKDGPGGIPVNATTYSVPGVVFRGNVPSRNASWAEAQPALDWREARFHWQDGKLVPEEEGK
jgi:hypothetical protein